MFCGVSNRYHMGLKRSIHEAPTARLVHGEHREVHMRGEHQHRWHPSTKRRHQGLVPSLRDRHDPSALRRSRIHMVSVQLRQESVDGE